MSERTSEGQRLEFYQRNMRGETYAKIAESCGVSLECVRYWCQRQKKGAGVKSRWHSPKRGVLSQFEGQVIEQIRVLRQQHPRWGPISLRIHLEQAAELKGKRLPSPASIGRFLPTDPENWRRPKKKPPELASLSLMQVHQRWEMDFKVQIRLQEGETVQLHTVTDPFSGAQVGTYLYSSRPGTSRVPLQDVQATLRACFTEWGTLPEEIQTDGEPILVATPGELPTPFTLWLARLGMRHRRISPGRPTQNGSVERSHRTLYEYALLGQLHRSRLDSQAFLQQCRAELNTLYPSRAKGCDGQPPLTARPELLQPRRPYRPEFEEALFDLGKVDYFLADYPIERKVGFTGQISSGGLHEYYLVGRPFARQFVQIRFEPATRDFVAYPVDQQTHPQAFRRWPARNLDAQHLLWPGTPAPLHSPQQLPLPWQSLGYPIDFPKKVYC